MHENCRNGRCYHSILGSCEGDSTKYVSQEDILDFMVEQGFSTAFCRRPTEPLTLPTYVEGDFSVSDHTALRQPGLYKRLHVTATYSWDISPDADNVAALVDALTYKVHPDGDSGSLTSVAFEDIPRSSLDDDENEPSLANIFVAHKANLSSFEQILMREPRQFLGMANTLFGQSDLNNVQFWDCVLLIEKMATAYTTTDRTPELMDVLLRLAEAGLNDTVVSLFRYLHILPVMLVIIKFMQCMMHSCYGDVEKERRFRESSATRRVYEEFWLQLGRHLTLTRGDAGSFGLVYHDSQPVVYGIHVRSKLVALAMYSFLVGIDPKIYVGINPQAYRMICRAGLLCWLYPVNLPAEPDAAFNNSTIFPGHLLSVYTIFRQSSGLTEQDLDTFVKEDIIGEYGAEVFIVRVTDLLLELRGIVHTEKHFDTLITAVDNLRNILVHLDFRRYYTSSGFIQALCDLADNPRLQQLSDSVRWDVHRSVLKVVDVLLESSSIGKAAKPLLRNGIFPILAQSSTLFARVGLKDDHLLDNVVEPFMIIAGGARARGNERDQEIFDTIEQSVKPDWYSTIHSLRSIPPLIVELPIDASRW